jgi:penicillin amidase
MKVAAKILAALVVLLVLVVAGGWMYLRGSLPAIDGEVAVRDVIAPVEVLRDAEGVPHLFAANERDGWYAMGYVHAQDRLWQMEFQRRVVRGRLSEFLGERAFDTDRLMRTLGMARTAEAIVAKLDADTVANLEAYAAGVNAFLASDPVLPVEFQAFRLKPEPWKPADSVGWLLVMAWDLSANWRTELARLRFAAKLGRERAAEILPPYPGDPAWPLPDFKALYAEVSATAGQLLAAFPLEEHAVGSNNWVVSGEKSATGKPLLANDPHLGLQTPALWYFAHVATPQGDVVGGTLPGVPFVVLGHNGEIAWSMTTTGGDTQDLYVERVAGGDASMYVTPSGNAKFDVREESIRVGNEERKVTIRATRHGPVISDAVKAVRDAAPRGHVLAIAWAALRDDNAVARAGFAMNRARTREAFMEALRDFHAPQQNVVFADRAGHIDFIAPARVPVRDPANEAMGRVPVPGWDAKYDWRGFIPFEDLPQLHDPAEGMIVTANHKVTSPDYKPFMSVDWFPPYRANRIRELLSAQPKHTMASFARMQADAESQLAKEMLPYALAAQPASQAGQRARDLLKGWNGAMDATARPPLVFAAWYRELARLVYADDLGELFTESWDIRATFMAKVLRNDDGMGAWCDDVRTPAKESCAELAGAAFDKAGADMEERYGKSDSWRWGRAHWAASDHRPFGFVPVIGGLFNVTPETSGDGYTINVGHYFIRDEARPFANRHAPSMRALYDLADLDKSLFMHSTGQSGNFLSPWYANLAERWAKVEYIAIPTRREAIKAAHRLVLKP